MLSITYTDWLIDNLHRPCPHSLAKASVQRILREDKKKGLEKHLSWKRVVFKFCLSFLVKKTNTGGNRMSDTRFKSVWCWYLQGCISWWNLYDLFFISSIVNVLKQNKIKGKKISRQFSISQKQKLQHLTWLWWCSGRWIIISFYTHTIQKYITFRWKHIETVSVRNYIWIGETIYQVLLLMLTCVRFLHSASFPGSTANVRM